MITKNNNEINHNENGNNEWGELYFTCPKCAYGIKRTGYIGAILKCPSCLTEIEEPSIGIDYKIDHNSIWIRRQS